MIKQKCLIISFLILSFICSGCACTSWLLTEGWSTHFKPWPGSSIAEKKNNGDLKFEYPRRIYSTGMFGPEANDKISIEQVTIDVSKEELRPLYTVLIDRSYMYQVSLTTDDYSSSHILPTYRDLKGFLSKNKNKYVFIMPDKESMIYLEPEWYWYVPPKKEGEDPKIAVVSSHIKKIHWYTYPLRIVSVPITMVGDIITLSFLNR